MRWFLSFGLTILCGWGSVDAACPNLDSFQRWSNWTGKPAEGEGESVIISESIVLDESADLFSINISSTGRLVWDPDVNVDLRVSYIWVEGRLDIGSEECPYEGKTTITFTGNRGDYELAAGPKGLIVAAGGTLELHGKRKLSWTKLSKTVQKLENTDELLYDHLSDERGSFDSETYGMVAYSVSLGADDTFTIKDFGVYNLHQRKDKNHIKNTERLVKQIEDLDDGDIFMMATQRSNPVKPEKYIPTPAYDAFETLVFGNVTGNSLFRGINRPDTYATVIQKGYPDSFKEVKGVGKDSMVYLTADGSNLSFKVHCYGAASDSKQYENFQIMTELGRYPVIDVIDNVTSWQPGDQILLASTDFDWRQVEERTVVECQECSDTQIKIDAPLTYMHWGEMVEDRVDERGEVALLTRNIVLRGEMQATCPGANENCNEYDYDTFGAHVKVLNGFSDVHIEGVELYDVGQQTDLGRYPLHFHMCLNTSESQPYLRDNSIHHTYARCITIHGTHHVKVEDNVCYKSLGHSYFLEDGSEMYNTFDGNIAIGTLPASLIPTDIEHATSFWITNPLTYVRNNVAAGGDGTGFWYIYPIQPTGPSRNLNLLEPWEASKTRLLDCENNVAHSNEVDGFRMEEHLDDDGIIQQTNFFQPLEDPRNSSSACLTIDIDRYTGYKNRRSNIWLQGGFIRLTNASSADSVTGIAIFNTQHRDKYGELTHSVLVGESENIGEPTTRDGVYYPRSFPYIKYPNYPRQGYAFYKGPQYVVDNYFVGFNNNPYYSTGALSWRFDNVYFTAAHSAIKNALFGFDDSAQAGNRIHQAEEGDNPVSAYQDGDKSVSLEDLDNGVMVMKSDPFTAVDGCVLRPNWKMANCPQKYGKETDPNPIKIDQPKKVAAVPNEFALFNPEALGTNLTDQTTELTVPTYPISDREKTTGIMVRDDVPLAEMEFTFKKISGYPLALGGKHSYTLAWSTIIPEEFYLKSDGIEKDAWVRVGVCIPRDAVFKIQQMGGVHRVRYDEWNNVTSLDELEKEDELMGTKLFHDADKGIIYVVLHSNFTRAADEKRNCPEGLCPIIKFNLLGGTNTDGDCRSRVFTEAEYAIKPKTLPENIDVIPANAEKAPDTWGAGSTRPFQNRQPSQ